MGLYLCIFDGDEDVDGVDVGAYADPGFRRSLPGKRLWRSRSGLIRKMLLSPSLMWTASFCSNVYRVW